jgi:hypothetical protein
MVVSDGHWRFYRQAEIIVNDHLISHPRADMTIRTRTAATARPRRHMTKAVDQTAAEARIRHLTGARTIRPSPTAGTTVADWRNVGRQQ